MKHIGLKITAFIFGIALWLYVMSLNTFQITMDIPLRLVKLPEKLAIASKPPQTLTVTMEGEAFDLMRMHSRIKRGDSTVASIIIDLQNAELGATRRHIYSKNFSAPSFPNVKFIEPDNQLLFVDLELDTKIERHIPIRSNITINTADGYILTEEPKLSPNFITVYGARNAITRIIEIPTDSVHFDSVQSDGVFSVPLNFGQLSSHVMPSDRKTDVHVDVQKIATKIYSDIPIQLIGIFDKQNFKLVPQTMSVEITGGERILDSLKTEDIELFIEYNRFAIEDVDSLAPTIKIHLDPSINRERSIKATQLSPEKATLVKTATADSTAKNVEDED